MGGDLLVLLLFGLAEDLLDILLRGGGFFRFHILVVILILYTHWSLSPTSSKSWISKSQFTMVTSIDIIDSFFLNWLSLDLKYLDNNLWNEGVELAICS